MTMVIRSYDRGNLIISDSPFSAWSHHANFRDCTNSVRIVIVMIIVIGIQISGTAQTALLCEILRLFMSSLTLLTPQPRSFVCFFLDLFVCLLVCLLICLFVDLIVCLLICLLACWFVCLLVCLYLLWVCSHPGICFVWFSLF